MKRIFLTVMSAVVFSTSAHAIEPFSFGLKGNAVVSNLTEMATNVSPTKESKGYLGNLGGGFGGYFEYALHDMVGLGIDAAYAGGIVGKTAPKGAKDDKNDTTCTQHAVRILLPYVSFTPLGREDREETGILYFNLGLQHDVRLAVSKTDKKSGTETVDKAYKKEVVNFWGFGVGGAVGYEFPFNLTLEARGGYEISDYFSDKLQNRKTSNNKKSSNLFNAGLALGYNLASLMEE